MGMAIVLVDTFVPGFPPVKDIFDNVENILHFAPNSGFAFFKRFLVFPCQIVAKVSLKSSSLAIDLIFSFDAVCYIFISAFSLGALNQSLSHFTPHYP